MAEYSGVDEARLRPYLFVHHGERAVDHLFMTVSGLDSMVTGESQIRYQVRNALQTAREAAAVGPTLSDVVETSLRVGKRVQTETRIDEAGRSLADEGFTALGGRGVPMDGATVVVLGAGSMASVAAVAHVEVRTRRKSDELGTRIDIEGSEVKKQEACQAQPGTRSAGLITTQLP